MGTLTVPQGVSEESLHLHDRSLRHWLWTQLDTWPYLFVHDRSPAGGRWLLHVAGTITPDRWFYDFSRDTFIHKSTH